MFLEQTLHQIHSLAAQGEFKNIDELNEHLQKTMGKGGVPPKPATDKARAQDLALQALSTDDSRKRTKLAKEALRLWPDCADAYVALAEAADSLPESLEIYKEAIEAAERDLGPDFQKEYAGGFWGFLETRPYMRARQGHAQILTLMGLFGPAINEYRELLELNPADNQGIRYELLNCLLKVGRLKEAQALGNKHKEDSSAVIGYGRALCAFLLDGSGKKADDLLKTAIADNPHVSDYFLFKKEMPDEIPSLIGLGDESEAQHYCGEMGFLWLNTPGALEWLAKETVSNTKSKKRTP